MSTSRPIQVLIVNKNATLTPYHIKDYDETKLFKKCGFKSPNGFKSFATWTVSLNKAMYVVRLYGKDTGKALSENKYEFPPPADNVLLFGNAVLVCFAPECDENNMTDCNLDDDVVNLTPELWKRIENKLFGGFVDLDVSEDPSSDELEDISPSLKTKSGYLKDDFVCEDAIKEKPVKKTKRIVKPREKAAAEDTISTTTTTTTTKATSVKSIKKTGGKKKKEELPEKKTILLTEEEYE